MAPKINWSFTPGILLFDVLFVNVSYCPLFRQFQIKTERICLHICVGWKCSLRPDWTRMSREACGTQGPGDPGQGTAGLGQGDVGPGQREGGQGQGGGGLGQGKKGLDLVEGGPDPGKGLGGGQKLGEGGCSGAQTIPRSRGLSILPRPGQRELRRSRKL